MSRAIHLLAIGVAVVLGGTAAIVSACWFVDRCEDLIPAAPLPTPLRRRS